MYSTDGILQGRFQQRTLGTEQHCDVSDLYLFAHDGPKSGLPRTQDNADGNVGEFPGWFGTSYFGHSPAG
ncbi:hypothetical protein N7523_007335 [Penicillium sp. IBT 18751x]|nr:hypothetical protein N7523_007335 [Penicillium sp. IBT 18751x]